MLAFGYNVQSFTDQFIFMFRVTYHSFLCNEDIVLIGDKIITRQIFIYWLVDAILFLFSFEFPDIFRKFCFFFIIFMWIIIPWLEFCFTDAEVNFREVLFVSFYFCRINNWRWQEFSIEWALNWILTTRLLNQSFVSFICLT